MGTQGGRWWRRGDLDGFFGLFVDNLIQLLLITSLCGGLLKIPDELLFDRILPGVALSLLIGNAFYAWQADRLRRSRGQPATALPYGINTPSLFAFVLFVMLPVERATGDAELAWRMGLAACLGSGLIECAGAFVAGWIKAHTPRAALLATLAGIALSFISMDFAFRIFADPLVGLAPLGLLFMAYIGRRRLWLGIPGGLAAVVCGTLLAWLMGRMDAHAVALAAGWHPPLPAISALIDGVVDPRIAGFLAVIVPMGLFNLAGSLQNLESAEAAGDRYPVRPSLLANGLGTITAACFGSCFPTTIYIGHPAWKEMGAGCGYSVANGVVVSLLVLSGTIGAVAALVPVEAGAALLLWIGVIIAAQAFRQTPPHHAPAVVVGLIPAFAAWGWMMVTAGLHAAGATIGAVGLEALQRQLPVAGMLALERGFIFTSMIWAAFTVALIEGRRRQAALWMGVGAAMSLTGLIHGFRLVGDAVVQAWGVTPAGASFAAGYALIASLCLLGGREQR
ncbi:MAG: NCS2 family permease [Zetaproteobacteria bacterium]|nr:MAG: NCS2 family permease [Zetaproteobacteria bacterium]